MNMSFRDSFFQTMRFKYKLSAQSKRSHFISGDIYIQFYKWIILLNLSATLTKVLVIILGALSKLPAQSKFIFLSSFSIILSASGYIIFFTNCCSIPHFYYPGFHLFTVITVLIAVLFHFILTCRIKLKQKNSDSTLTSDPPDEFELISLLFMTFYLLLTSFKWVYGGDWALSETGCLTTMIYGSYLRGIVHFLANQSYQTCQCLNFVVESILILILFSKKRDTKS